MPSIAAHRVGSSLLSFELATRSRALAFTVTSAERNRSHLTHLQYGHSQPQQFRPQSSQSTPARVAPRSHFQPFSTDTHRMQQAAQPQTSSSGTSAAPPPSSAQSRATSPAPTRTASTHTSQASAPPSPSIPPQDPPLTDISASGLSDAPPPPYTPTDPSIDPQAESRIDWARSFHGLSTTPFSAEAAAALTAALDPKDIEIKPDGIVYLPEIKYRRILNRAFGPGGWGLAPRSETIVTAKLVTREYALLAHGRLVSVARGEQEYFDREGIPTATEGCKSNALMRCCKDLGVASELWDPRFIRVFMKENGRQVWVEHVVNKRKRQIWVRKGEDVAYPYKETKSGAGA